MKTNWVLITSSINAYVVVNENTVYLTTTDKDKRHNSAVVRKLKSENSNTTVFKKFVLKNSDFEMKLGKGLEVYVSNSDLPGGSSKFYKLGNFVGDREEGVWRYIDQFTIDKGIIQENPKFKLCISDNYKDIVFLVSKDMREYDSCKEEMKRRLGLEIYSKTRKWEPGHKYYTETETVYCLGKFKSRISDPVNSDFCVSSMMSDVYLITHKIDEDTEKTSSEIFKSHSFGLSREDQISVEYSPKSMVDAGEVFKPDVTDFSSLWETMITNTIRDNMVTTKYGYSDYTNSVLPVLEILSIQSEKHENYATSISDNIRNSVEEMLEYSLTDMTMRFWNRKDKLNDKSLENSIDKVATQFKELYWVELGDCNSKRKSYYKDLFFNIGIDFDKLVDDYFKSVWSSNWMFSDFDRYTKFYTRFNEVGYTNNNSKLYSDQRNLTLMSYDRRTNSVKSISKLVDDTKYPELVKTIQAIAKEADSNFGLNVKYWKIINVGTSRKPLEYVDMMVSLDDIINYYSGEVPDDLKSEIINRKFLSINIQYDYGKDVL